MTGTPFFNGERLRDAREARGLTVVQLAELVGVTKQAVSLYERSKSGPAPATFERLADVLGVPKQHLLLASRPEPSAAIFYRSMASATKRMRTRAERRLGWFRDIVTWVAGYVNLPTVDVPDLGFPPDPARVTADQVEQSATTVRRLWGMGDGPIQNVTMLLEAKGIAVTRFELGAEKLDAFLVWEDDTLRPCVVLGADKASAVRSRFDAAHELGHLIVHRHVPKRLLGDAASFKLIEDQAHRFARAFLMPQETFAREYLALTLSALTPVKQKWRVSVAAIAMRAGELGLLSED